MGSVRPRVKSILLAACTSIVLQLSLYLAGYKYAAHLCIMSRPAHDPESCVLGAGYALLMCYYEATAALFIINSIFLALTPDGPWKVAIKCSLLSVIITGIIAYNPLANYFDEKIVRVPKAHMADDKTTLP